MAGTKMIQDDGDDDATGQVHTAPCLKDDNVVNG